MQNSACGSLVYEAVKGTETMSARELLSGMSLLLVLFSFRAEAADIISGVPYIVDGDTITIGTIKNST